MDRASRQWQGLHQGRRCREIEKPFGRRVHAAHFRGVDAAAKPAVVPPITKYCPRHENLPLQQLRPRDQKAHAALQLSKVRTSGGGAVQADPGRRPSRPTRRTTAPHRHTTGTAGHAAGTANRAATTTGRPAGTSNSAASGTAGAATSGSSRSAAASNTARTTAADSGSPTTGGPAAKGRTYAASVAPVRPSTGGTAGTDEESAGPAPRKSAAAASQTGRTAAASQTGRTADTRTGETQTPAKTDKTPAIRLGFSRTAAARRTVHPAFDRPGG